MSRAADLARIRMGLERAVGILREVLATGGLQTAEKPGGRGPVTEADLRVDRALRDSLPLPGEGWLSEETADDPSRLEQGRCWVVDPIDGTLEMVRGIPEWCISIGLVEEGAPVAGGILNPATGEWILGALETGVTLNGEPVPPRGAAGLQGARVYASRSELRRGEWDRYGEAGFTVVPCGSVAYKLGLVAAGVADATWTLVPKHEWDVAAGVALVRAAGLEVTLADGTIPAFNRADPVLPNLLAGPRELLADVRATWL